MHTVFGKLPPFRNKINNSCYPIMNCKGCSQAYCLSNTIEIKPLTAKYFEGMPPRAAGKFKKIKYSHFLFLGNYLIFLYSYNLKYSETKWVFIFIKY